MTAREGNEQELEVEVEEELDPEPEFVSQRDKKNLDAYIRATTEKYGDDKTKHPVIDHDLWLECFGPCKKGRWYGFGKVKDPLEVLTDMPVTQSTFGTHASSSNTTKEVENLKETVDELKRQMEVQNEAHKKEVEEATQNAARTAAALVREQFMELMRNPSSSHDTLPDPPPS